MVQITKDKFQKYLELQIEGSLNMNLHKQVSEKTGLTVEEIKEIQVNYGNYLEQFKGFRDELEVEYLYKLFNKE